MRAFVEAPSEKSLNQCTKDQLVKIAEFYSFDVDNKRVKETLKANLVRMKVLGTAEAAPFSMCTEDTPPSVIAGPGAGRRNSRRSYSCCAYS